MLVLSAGALPTLLKRWQPNLGRLVTPRDHARLYDTAQCGLPWAADNDALNGFNEQEYLEMLEVIACADPAQRLALQGCLFVAIPDDATMGPDGPIVSAEGTLELFETWQPALAAAYDFPLALVLQDGQEGLPVPWRRISAIFVGGTTSWKIGPHAAELVAEARRRGKYVHMGRVNSARRAAYAGSIGCNSFDGTGASKFRNRRLPEYLSWARPGAQLRLTA
jgi:hypothetical protein